MRPATLSAFWIVLFSAMSATPPPAFAAARAWEAKFGEPYRLADGENAKLIAPPFTDERLTYHRENHPGVANIPGQYGFRLKKGDAALRQISWSSDPGTVASALEIASIERVDLDGPTDLFDVKVPGDWIIRDGAKREQILADVKRILLKATDGKIKLEATQVEKDVIVARGRFKLAPMTDPAPPRQAKDVHLFTDKLDPQEGAGGGSASMKSFLQRVAEVAEMKVINETEPHKGDVSWANNHSASDAAKSTEKRDLLLKNVTAQTGLDFRIERRKVDAWRLIDTTGKAGGL